MNVYQQIFVFFLFFVGYLCLARCAYIGWQIFVKHVLCKSDVKAVLFGLELYIFLSMHALLGLFAMAKFYEYLGGL